MNSRIFLKKDSVSTANEPKEQSTLTPNQTDARDNISSNYTNQSALNLVIGGTKLPMQDPNQVKAATDENTGLNFPLNEESTMNPAPV